MKRFNFVINYEGTNRTNNIMSEGQDIYECLENLLDEIEDFKNHFENNKFETGGHTVFTKDAEQLYQECDDIAEEINKVLGNI